MDNHPHSCQSCVSQVEFPGLLYCSICQQKKSEMQEKLKSNFKAGFQEAATLDLARSNHWKQVREDLQKAKEALQKPSGLGLAHVKMEGGPVHPDDILAPMTKEQEARQLKAYEQSFNQSVTLGTGACKLSSDFSSKPVDWGNVPLSPEASADYFREQFLTRPDDPIHHLIKCYESEIRSEFEGTSMLEQKLAPAKAAREHLARSMPAKPLMHSSLASAADEEARLMVALESLRRKNPSLVHPDQAAVRKFASAMEAKMAVARSKGRSGWNNPAECSIDLLQDLLRGHLLKGDPVDVANFCMMLWNRGAKVVMP